MRFVSFEDAEGAGFGALIDGLVTRLDGIADGPVDLKEYIARDHRLRGEIPLGGPILKLTDVRLLPPIPNPGKVLCVATNFHEPAREGKPDPDYPITFTRFADSFTGHDQPLIKPALSDRYDFEGELAVVIGKPGHKISESAAMEHVAGYCCLNDGSVRDWQKHSTQFTPGKNFYRSGSLGPWLVPADEVPDVSDLCMEARVNGVKKQKIVLGQMIFSIPWLIAYFSTFTPLAPGDIIATGTPSGFGSSRQPPEFLEDGDVVEIEISGIGTLRNVVTQDAIHSSDRAFAALPLQA